MARKPKTAVASERMAELARKSIDGRERDEKGRLKPRSTVTSAEPQPTPTAPAASDSSATGEAAGTAASSGGSPPAPSFRKARLPWQRRRRASK